jgi:hypothetical protein
MGETVPVHESVDWAFAVPGSRIATTAAIAVRDRAWRIEGILRCDCIVQISEVMRALPKSWDRSTKNKVVILLVHRCDHMRCRYRLLFSALLAGSNSRTERQALARTRWIREHVWYHCSKRQAQCQNPRTFSKAVADVNEGRRDRARNREMSWSN